MENDLRRWMRLMETWFATARGDYGDVDIFKNPSKLEFNKLVRASGNGHLRGYIDQGGDNSLYVWDASVLIHLEADDAVHLIDPIAIQIRDHDVVIRHPHETFEDEDIPGIVEDVRNHPTLRHCLGTFTISIER